VSGFAGIIRIEPNADSIEKDRLAIELMARAIAFRGPDGCAATNQHCHRLFCILTSEDRSRAARALATLYFARRNLVSRRRVRCDGREELKQKLVQHGVELPASPSSEHLVLQYFAKCGESWDCQTLNGDLSFILWNAGARKLVGYRDLTGARPLFYSHQNGALLFSNTLQAVALAFFRFPRTGRGFHRRFSAWLPLLQSKRYRPIAIFAVFPLVMYWNFQKNGLFVRRIANMPIEDLLILKRDEEYIEEFQRLFTQSVRDQLPPIDTSILLSGGLDSTTLAARAVSLRKEDSTGSDLKLHALSVDSRPAVDDEESDLASRFAASLGIPCQVVPLR